MVTTMSRHDDGGEQEQGMPVSVARNDLRPGRGSSRCDLSGGSIRRRCWRSMRLRRR